tara:strand:+ start:84 stop:425 length:342 start_codon:yes stop_codon:yes gene_type:complete
MGKKLQYTRLSQNIGQILSRLEQWSVNPWRRFSLLIIVLLIGFFIGSSIGVINGVLALMDPIGALIILLILEFMIRVRRNWPVYRGSKITLEILDTVRIGLLYGLILEGFKLL